MARGNHFNGKLTLEFIEQAVLVTTDAEFYPYLKFKVSQKGFLIGCWSSVISFQGKTTKLTRDGFYRDKVVFVGENFVGGVVEKLSANQIMISQKQ